MSSAIFFFHLYLLNDLQFIFLLFVGDFLQAPLKLLLEVVGLSGILHFFQEFELTICNKAFLD